MTVNIAICHDDRRISSKLESMIIRIMRQKGVDCETEVFESGTSLCKELERQHFDLIFMDVDLPEQGGVEVSKYIRDQLKNYIVKIAYISENDFGGKELFEFVPIGYLTKELVEEQVVNILNRYLVMTRQENQLFRYKKRGVDVAIPYADILYLESDGHQIVIYTRDFDDEFYGTIDDVYQELQAHKFLRIHQSIIVNFHYVQKRHYKIMELKNGKKLPISQSRRKEVKTRYEQLKAEEKTNKSK